MTSSLAPLSVQIAQIHDRKAEGGGEKCFGNRSQGVQLHNCTKEKGFFFVFPSHILQTEKMLLESWMEKLQHHSSLWGHEMY